ncbi:MAG: hypothetical protein DWQ48_06200 [Bacteroidetes bacterium]|nr:MAG: hypothetical protein DWQ48_06200 [Bacteroidota bacterium]
MEFKDVLSVPGMSGLYKIVGNNKSGFIVESLIDGKRSLINSSQRIMTLIDIGVYSSDEEIPLQKVFSRIESSGNDSEINIKASPEDIRSLFARLIPEYDADRVYDSDIKKIFSWYLLLKGKVDFNKEVESGDVNEAVAASQNAEKHIPKIHEGHGPKADQHAKTTSARTRKKV